MCLLLIDLPINFAWMVPSCHSELSLNVTSSEICALTTSTPSLKQMSSPFFHTPIYSSAYYFTSIQFSHSVVSDSLWLHGLQQARLPCPSPTTGVYSNSCPSSWWCHPTISPPVMPSPPAFNISQHQGLFQWVSSSCQVVKVLDVQLQHQSFQWMFRTDFL